MTELSDQQIAEALGVSRTPVHEAILRLQLGGLVVVVPRVGTFVARLDRQAIDDALFVREQLECGALAALHGRPRSDTLEELAGCVAAHAAALQVEDFESAMAADGRFHFALLRAATRPGIWPQVHAVRDLVRRLRALALPRLQAGATALAEHRAIVEKLGTGQIDEAVGVLRAHIRRNDSFVQALATRHPDYFTEGTPR